VYGVPEERLGGVATRRTLFKREVLPEHVAAAVFALSAGDLSLTPGPHVPVDGGVAAGWSDARVPGPAAGTPSWPGYGADRAPMGVLFFSGRPIVI
jgi:hypothetical protein